MLTHPTQKYRAFPSIQLSNRTWPSKTITAPPIWLSTDLRDGNQALAEPMTLSRKLQMFKLLVQLGFKEIEVGFPSASQTEFDFIRYLIEQDLIPADVTIQVLTQARESLIYRTFEALRGVKQAIVHVYNATAPAFRRIVFGLDKAETVELAVSAATLLKQLAAAQPETDWRFQYSPETFTATELAFAKEICDAVLDVWEPTPDRRAIINLPASVEVATPNVFADQVEWMHRHLVRRDAVVLSVHPHNDRGCGVAAAELAQMAGADRVEGCLFGNGERTGNVDLVTLAMNLYTQGIHPGLDFSAIDAVAQVVKDCTQLPIHPRHPYVGELVYTAFSGSHQDAIKKGFAAQDPNGLWEVPYLPMDPADVGRSYEAVVRVNSQSGKGGIAFLLERHYGVVLPRQMQVEFSGIVQRVMDAGGQELSAEAIWQIFEQTYLHPAGPINYRGHRLMTVGDDNQVQKIETEITLNGQPLKISGAGNGPIDALVNGLSQTLNLDIQVQHYEEKALEQGSWASAIAILELSTPVPSHGIGIHENIVTASLLAVINAVNRAQVEVEVRGLAGVG
ncbi:MAG: 2-isopropylmalate synthase [Cyanobacteria bacterium P01_A01_bin.114]